MLNRIRSYFKDLSANVMVLSLGSFFNDISSEMVYPLLPVFLTLLGAGKEFIGLIEGLAESTASITKLLSGWYSDRIGARKPIAVFGYSLSTLTRPFVALAFKPWHVLASRFTDRIGKGIRTSPRDALISTSVDKKVQAKAFGFHRALDNLGALVGPGIAMILLYLLPHNFGVLKNYRIVFWASCIPAVMAVLVLWLWVRETPLKKNGQEPKGRPALAWRSLDKRFRTYVIIVFIFTLGNSSDAFLLLRARDLGLEDYHLPLVWMLLSFVKAATNIPGGGLADKWGRRRVIIIGWVVYALIYAGFAAANSEWHVWALFALYGIYFGMTEGAERALVSDLTPEGVRGTAFGFFHLSVGLAAFPASVLFGYVWDKTGKAEIAFGMGAGFALLAAILLAIMVHAPAKPADKAG
jgi:MFS family permease